MLGAIVRIEKNLESSFVAPIDQKVPGKEAFSKGRVKTKRGNLGHERGTRQGNGKSEEEAGRANCLKWERWGRNLITGAEEGFAAVSPDSDGE